MVTAAVQMSSLVYRGVLDLLRTKTLSILSGSNERFDHLGSNEAAVELIQFRLPEVVTAVVSIW